MKIKNIDSPTSRRMMMDIGIAIAREGELVGNLVLREGELVGILVLTGFE